MVVFTLFRLGNFLKNRNIALEMREQVEQKLADDERVVLHFNKVVMMSRPFAEELVGELAAKYGMSVFEQKVTLKNLLPKVEKMLESVIVERTAQERDLEHEATE